MEKEKHRSAIRAARLLRRPDRLIGVILIGNNLVNFIAASIAGIIGARLVGADMSTWLTPIVLTFIVLVFAEVTPKTFAALNPEKIAFPASWVLMPLLKVLYPAVWLVNKLSNMLVRLFGGDPHSVDEQQLEAEEFRTVVNEAGQNLHDQHQGMMLNVLDLEQATVEDIMIPRNEVVGLNLEEPVADLLQQIRNSEYTRLPVYENDLNNVLGVLHLRNAARFLFGDDTSVTHEAIRRFSTEPYFVPEATSLTNQLLNFKNEKCRMGIVVDEYGQVQGIATLEDLLEEIVGEFTTDIAEEAEEDIKPLADGWYRIDGGETIREINRALDWSLPTDGPKTINGLCVEHLETIPEAGVSFQISEYWFEIVQFTDKKIEKLKARKSVDEEEE